MTVLAETLPVKAEIVELPTLRQVARPVAFTESNPLELDFQVTDPVTSFDAVLLRLSLALNCEVAPNPESAVKPAIVMVGYVETAKAGTLQVNRAVANAPSLLAVTVAVPAARQVTNPDALIESGPLGNIFQTAEAATSTAAAPPEVSDACSCSVCPIAVRFEVPVIASVAGAAAAVQVIETEFTAPSLLADTCAVPAATQVTNPPALTVSVPAGMTCQSARAVMSAGAAVPVLSLACS